MHLQLRYNTRRSDLLAIFTRPVQGHEAHSHCRAATITVRPQNFSSSQTTALNTKLPAPSPVPGFHHSTSCLYGSDSPGDLQGLGSHGVCPSVSGSFSQHNVPEVFPQGGLLPSFFRLPAMPVCGQIPLCASIHPQMGTRLFPPCLVVPVVLPVVFPVPRWGHGIAFAPLQRAVDFFRGGPPWRSSLGGQVLPLIPLPSPSWL